MLSTRFIMHNLFPPLTGGTQLGKTIPLSTYFFTCINGAGNIGASSSGELFSYNAPDWTVINLPRSGNSVSINNAGDRVVFGMVDPNNGSTIKEVVVLSYGGVNWTQLGQALSGTSNVYGNSVSLNSVGDRIAVASRRENNDAGAVRIFTYSGSVWTQTGQTLSGAETGGDFGESVSINSAGDIVAVGAPYVDGLGGFYTGQVKVYYFDGSNWIQRGQTISGSVINEEFGWSVAINSTGDRVIVGSRRDSTYKYSSGAARVFTYSGGTWSQTGQTIYGSAGNFFAFGSCVDINSVGDRIVIGGDSGYARVYSYDGVNWVKIGSDITDIIYGISSVSMNSAGDRVLASNKVFTY